MIGSQPTPLNLLIDLLRDLLHGDQQDVSANSFITNSMAESGKFINEENSG